jgi:hypothetical protein
MATFNKFQDFSQQLAEGKQNFGTDAFKVALSNSAPVATNTVLADITQITAANGYTSGGTATTVTVSETSGTTTVSGTQVVFTASGGSIGPFRYVVLYNDTTTSPSKPLVGWWDYGSPGVTLADTETFTVKFSNTSPGAIFTLT